MKMFSMSLGISFSGLLHYMLAYFTGSVALVLSELIDRVRASNVFETQNFDSLQLLQEILPRKKVEPASSDMELDSEFKYFKASVSSSKPATTNNQSRLKIDVSEDSIMKQEHLFSKFRNKGASSSKEVPEQSGAVISHPRSKACSDFHKGKVVLLASAAEDLNSRLKILEEENEIMKQAFIETAVERKKLVNEICQLYETLRYNLQRRDQEDGHTSSYGSLIIEPSKVKDQGTAERSLSQALLENPGFGS